MLTWISADLEFCIPPNRQSSGRIRYIFRPKGTQNTCLVEQESNFSKTGKKKKKKAVSKGTVGLGKE